MELKRLAGGGCQYGDQCPTVYVADDGTAVVQGYLRDDLDIPAGEGLVAIPIALLVEAAQQVAR
jgi:hypothetical protein